VSRGRPSPRVRKKLAGLAAKPVNFDPEGLDLAAPPPGWAVDDRRTTLPAEPAGEPVSEGSFEIAARLILGYEFADPSIVRAFYDPGRPLEGRDMLLELRALGLARMYVGVRVGEVYDQVVESGGRAARVFGWYYRTLEGHVEMGQMNWEVLKWLDTGKVEFHVHSVSRVAAIGNPFLRVGFWLLKGHERALFLDSTGRRMARLTEAGLDAEDRGERIRRASSELTARRLPDGIPPTTGSPARPRNLTCQAEAHRCRGAL
jgi:uncharacterized protein (UPF0548 family)